MKNRQLVSLSNIKKYKDKYVTVKDIYNSTKNCIRVKSERGTRMLEYSEYYSILEAYLDEVLNVVVKEQEVFKLPGKLGKVYLKKLPHKRPFHVRLDNKSSNEANKPIYVKVPILDDEYTKVAWDRPYKYGKYKVLPLRRFKESIKQN